MSVSIEIVEPSVQLLRATSAAEQLIEQAARTCYKSQSKGDRGKFIRSLLRRGHFSVFEHAVATFRIVCDRGLTHELVRHRLASYSQESTRYVDYNDAFQFFQCATRDASSKEIMARHFKACAEAYEALSENGEPAQFARAMLPIGVKTEIVVTMNFAQWMHVMELRRFHLAGRAHPHIERVAGMILDKLANIAPNVFSDEAFRLRWHGIIQRYNVATQRHFGAHDEAGQDQEG